MQTFYWLRMRPEVPEHVRDLQLLVTRRASRPHFAVDPAWPPHGHEYEADFVPRRKFTRPLGPQPVQPKPDGHAYAVPCPVCNVETGRMCRDMEGKPTWAHFKRRAAAGQEAFVGYEEQPR